jgi:hypothetical protein
MLARNDMTDKRRISRRRQECLGLSVFYWNCFRLPSRGVDMAAGQIHDVWVVKSVPEIRS